MRKFIIAVVILIGVVFIFLSFTEMKEIYAVLRQGNIWYLLLALAIEGVWLVNVAASYKAIYRMLGIEEHSRHLLLLSTATNFVNTITPAAGLTGVAVMVDDAHRRGYSTGRVTVAWAIWVLFDYVGLLSVVSLGLAVLVRRGDLNWSEVTAAGILLVGAIILAVLLYLGMESTDLMARVLAWGAMRVNRVFHFFSRRDFLSVERAYTFASDTAEGMAVLRANRKRLIWPMLLTLSNKTFLVLIFLMIFLAFNVPWSIGTIVAGFSTGYLFVVVSPTPSGVGIMEGVMTLSLRSLRVPISAATVITLAFRAVTFWFPLLIGMFSFRVLSGMKANKATSLESSDSEVPVQK